MEEEKKQVITDENKDNKKKQHLIIAGIVGLTVFVGVGGYFVIRNKQSNLDIKENIVYELGDEVILRPKYFVENMNEGSIKEITLTSDLLKETDKYSLDKKTLEITSKKKDFLDVGKYSITLNYKEKAQDVNFEVKDTKAPVFKDFLQVINIEKDAENVDLKKFFDVSDFSKYELTIDEGEFDISKEGCYTITVTVEDEYGNKETKQSKVNVLSSKDAEKEGLSKTTDGKLAVSKDTQDKIDKGEINVDQAKPQVEKPKPQKPTENTEKPKPGHKHEWVETFKTVHHEAVYEDKYVVDQPAWDEPVYETRITYVCNNCKYSTNSYDDIWNHIEHSMINGGSCGSYTDVPTNIQVDTIHHDEVGHTEKVLVKEAWDERISTGFKCSCGAKK